MVFFKGLYGILLDVKVIVRETLKTQKIKYGKTQKYKYSFIQNY